MRFPFRNNSPHNSSVAGHVNDLTGIKSRAFIDFATIEQATAAVNALEGQKISLGEATTQIQRCNYARPRKDFLKTPVEPTPNLYIADIPSQHNVEELEPLFSGRAGFQNVFSGTLFEVLLRPPADECASSVAPARKWAIAYFDSIDNATSALDSVKEYKWKDSDRSIKIKYSTSRTNTSSASETAAA